MDSPKLDRKINLVQATALNMIDMVGIGPFVVLPLVIQMIGGPHFIFAWLLVAFVMIHVFEVIVSGLWNHLRSMITGNYRIKSSAQGARHE